MFTRRRTRISACALFVFAFAATASAHPISVVVESAFVERDRILIEVEVFAEDLYFYHNLKPNGKNEASAEALHAASKAHGRLLLERLPVFDSAGRRIEGGRVTGVEGDEFPKDIPLGELMMHSLVYRLELPLAEPPEFLSFTQRLVDAEAGFPALVDFRVKQAGRDDELEATLKPGQSRTVQLDWSSPPEDAAARDAWLRKHRDDALGATSLNTLRSFVYVAKREVRHELLIPFPLLESFMTIDRAEPDFVSHDEQQAAKPKIGEYFRGKNPLTIDGTPRTPESVRVEFFTLDDRNLAKAVPRRTVSAVNCRVGLILTYPVERPAHQVQLDWNAFNRQAWRVDAFWFIGDEILRPQFSAQTRKDTFVWTRPPEPAPEPVPVVRVPRRPGVTLPGLSLLVGTVGLVAAFALRRRPAAAVGVGVACLVFAVSARNHVLVTFARPFTSIPELPASETDAIIRTLHANLYRAADAGTDDEVVEALAAAADGPLLRSLVLQLVDTIRFGDDEETGTLAVQEVEVLSGERTGETLDNGGFHYLMNWEVTARLEHWGHVHDRRYRYGAAFRIEPRDGKWAMTDIELRDVRLLEDTSIETSVKMPAGSPPQRKGTTR